MTLEADCPPDDPDDPNDLCFDYEPRKNELNPYRTVTEPALYNGVPGVPARMAPKTWPGCNASGYIPIEPGYYNLVGPLTNLMNLCEEALFHFKPSRTTSTSPTRIVPSGPNPKRVAASSAKSSAVPYQRATTSGKPCATVRRTVCAYRQPPRTR